jgi:hypothetical protein
LHHQCGGAKRAESAEIAGYSASDPKYEGREPGRLQPERKYDKKNRRADFVKQAHR